MTPTMVLSLIAYGILLAGGQILFKTAADAARQESGNFVLALFTEPVFIAAIALYGLLTVAWSWILSRMPLSIAYPFVALAFVATPVLAHFLLGERISTGTMVGTALVISGLLVIVQSN